MTACSSPGPAIIKAESIEIRGAAGVTLVDNETKREAIAKTLLGLIEYAPATTRVEENAVPGGERPRVLVNFFDDRPTGKNRVLATVLVFGPEPGPESTPADEPYVCFRSRSEANWNRFALHRSAARSALEKIETASGIQLAGLLDLDASAMDALHRSVEQLASRVSVSGDRIRWQSVTAVEWPNAALGYPRPGMAYAMMLVPGHRVILLLPDGREIECHTSGNRVEFPPLANSDADSGVNKGVRG